MSDTKRSAPKIRDDIEDAISEGMASIKLEFEKLIKSVSSDLQEFVKISNQYVRDIEKRKIQWKEVDKEVKILRGKRNALKAEEKRVTKEAGRLKEQEENLLTLHTVLEKKKNLLDTREKEVKSLEKTSQEKVASPV